MGSYVNRSLLNGEVIVIETRLHRILYFVPVLLIILAAALLPILPLASAPLLFLGVAHLIGRMIRRTTSEYVVTNKRVVVKTGLLARQTLELVLSKVESIDVYQGVTARLFGLGKIIIVGTGGSREPFAMISKPIEFRRAVQNCQISSAS
jgi:uncharacterized membrane protein YdbT with pleckstrin-like domain